MDAPRSWVHGTDAKLVVLTLEGTIASYTKTQRELVCVQQLVKGRFIGSMKALNPSLGY